MNGLEFEHYVAAVMVDNGYHATVSKGSGDYGVDVVLDGDIAVQVKYYTNPVGPKAVQEAVAGKAVYGCAQAWVVTNSTFTNAAKVLAKSNGVKLVDGSELDFMAENPANTGNGVSYEEACNWAKIEEAITDIVLFSMPRNETNLLNWISGYSWVFNDNDEDVPWDLDSSLSFLLLAHNEISLNDIEKYVTLKAEFLSGREAVINSGGNISMFIAKAGDAHSRGML